MDFASPAIIYSTVFEDNNGATGLATPSRKTQWMRLISENYHFLREHVGEGKWIMIHREESKEQKAGYF